MPERFVNMQGMQQSRLPSRFDDFVRIDHAVGQAWEEPQVWASDDLEEFKDNPFDSIPCPNCGESLVRQFLSNHQCELQIPCEICGIVVSGIQQYQLHVQ